uniref:Uncharacterized protein n=1 Tax=Manihot esculenta TaxID=3983 RepID=A0A2C9VZB9_MANES
MVTRKTPYDALLRSLHLNPCPRNPILFVKSKLLIPRRALDLETVLDSQAKPPINSITCSRGNCHGCGLMLEPIITVFIDKN